MKIDFFYTWHPLCQVTPPTPNRHLIQNNQPLKNNGFESDDWEASNLQSSNEKQKPGCLGYTEDEILPIYVGMISNTMKQGSLLSNQVLMESKRMFFFSWLN